MFDNSPSQPAGRVGLALRWLGRGLALIRYAAIIAAIWASLKYSDDAVDTVINSGLFLLPLLLMLALSGRVAASISSAAAIAIFVYALGEMKLRYFDNRLAVSDFPFLDESANWIIVARYPLLYGSLIGFIAFALLLMLERRLNTRQVRSMRIGARARVGAAGLFVALIAFSLTNRQHHQWEVFRDDADCGLLKTCGVVSRLVYSTAVFEFDPPKHEADPAYFLDHMAAAPALDAPADAPKNPDIVVWLNESTFDPANYVLPRAQLPHLSMLDLDAHTRAASPLRVHTFGGKTWLSEFSLLTGLVPDDFGGRRSLVFNAVGPHTTTNLVRLLKSNGYHAVVLMPTFKRFYGAGRVYEKMGFDEVLTLRDFHEYDSVPGDEWDIATSPRLGEAAAKLIREHRSGADARQPLFLYLLSIMEHAPYSKHTPVAFGLNRSGITPSLASKLSDYIARLKVLSDAVSGLDRFLQADSRPAMLCYFGDHQAYFEEPPPPYKYTLPDPTFITQYRLRSNFVTAAVPPAATLDIAFLPSLLADLAGVTQDPYFSALSAMRRLCAGKLDDCEDHRLLESYKGYVYGDKLGLLAK